MTEKRSPEADLLLRNAVLPDGTGPIDIAVRRRRILKLGKNLPLSAKEEINLDGHLVVPGFVNLHCHLDKAYTSSLASNQSGTIQEARASLREAKRRFTLQGIQERAERALRMALRHGTTSLRSHVDIDPLVGLKGLKALAGLRSRFEGRLDIQIVAFPQEGFESMPETEALMAEAMRAGADLVGGSPFDDEDQERHVDILFRLAKQFDADLDIHADFHLPPQDELYEQASEMISAYIAKRTVEEGYQGRVTLDHVCAFDALPAPVAAAFARDLAQAGISVAAAPTSSLYGQGRHDTRSVRRGLTRVRDLLAAGVHVVYGTDNAEDAFNPLGTMDMLQEGLLLALLGHMTTPAEMGTVIEMATERAAELFGKDSYAITPGSPADLVVLEGDSVQEALIHQAGKRFVIKGGVIVASSQRLEQLHI